MDPLRLEIPLPRKARLPIRAREKLPPNPPFLPAPIHILYIYPVLILLYRRQRRRAPYIRVSRPRRGVPQMPLQKRLFVAYKPHVAGPALGGVVVHAHEWLRVEAFSGAADEVEDAHAGADVGVYFVVEA